MESPETSPIVEEKPSEEDPKDVARRWRTTSFILGSLAALLTAFGPITVWINGCQDRKLQESKAHDDVALRYMDLLLRRSETVEEREMTLSFLVKALASERPQELMLELATEQLEKIAELPKLKSDLDASREREQALVKRLLLSRERERIALERISTSTSTRIDEELRAEIEAEREARSDVERALHSERQQSTELQRQLSLAQAATGSKSAGENLSRQERLDRHFKNAGYSETEEKLLRELDALCAYHRGLSAFGYLGPHKPVVLCQIGDENVLLDEASLGVQNVDWGGPRMLAGDPFSPMAAYELCATIGGRPVSSHLMPDTVILCKVSADGRGVQVRRY